MIAAAIVFGMIHAVAPALPEASARRYAADIALVADTREDAAIYVTIAMYESDMRSSVESCAKTGDDGAAVSIYQLHAQHWGRHTRAEVCASNALATRLVASVTGRLRRVKGSVELMFMAYLGAKSVEHQGVRKRMETFKQLREET